MISSSSSNVGGGEGEGRYRGDSDWATKLVAGINAGKEESWARCECHDYTQGLLNLVLDKESGLSDVLTSVSIEEVQTVILTDVLKDPGLKMQHR